LANRKWAISIIAVLIVSLSSIGLYLLQHDPRSPRRIQELVKPYNSRRPGGGRLFDAPYRSLSSLPEPQTDIGKAQILLLKIAGIGDPIADTGSHLPRAW